MIKSFPRLTKAAYRRRYLFRKPNYGPKVFCLGFIRTGTTSLGQAFEKLGYLDSGYKSYAHQWFKEKDYDKIIKLTAKLDSTSDIPWSYPELIPLLYEVFPDSKFVYLTREENSWKKSYVKFHKRVNNYDADPNEGWDKLMEHQEFIVEFFDDKPNQLLQLTINDTLGLKKLTDFLSKPFIANAFPHANKSS